MRSISSWRAPRRRVPPPRWPRPSISIPTRCARTSNGCATSAYSTSRWPPAAASDDLSTSTRSPPTPPRWGSSRRCSPRSPACCSAWPRRLAPTTSDAVEAGRDQGRDDSRRAAHDRPCVDALVSQLAEFGFDPEVAPGETTTIGFAHCPFASLAEANPDLVCGLHRGMVEGFVETFDDAEVLDFRNSRRSPALPGRAGGYLMKPTTTPCREEAR